MAVDPPDLADRALERRKREDTALVVPVLGALLLVSPLLNVVAGSAALFGIPLAHFWIYTCWLGLILVVKGLARRLAN